MTAIASDSSTSGLIFAGRLPLAWRELPNLPDAAELREVERANLIILHTLFALDMHAGDFGDDPITLANATELKRLDFKVGLLLELVGQLYARQQAIPPDRSVILAVNGLSWQADSAPPPIALLQPAACCGWNCIATLAILAPSSFMPGWPKRFPMRTDGKSERAFTIPVSRSRVPWNAIFSSSIATPSPIADAARVKTLIPPRSSLQLFR